MCKQKWSKYDEKISLDVEMKIWISAGKDFLDFFGLKNVY